MFMTETNNNKLKTLAKHCYPDQRETIPDVFNL